MGRPKTEVRISLKGRDGRTVRLGLVRSVLPERWDVYRDGRRSERQPSASSTMIGNLIAEWLREQRKAFE